MGRETAALGLPAVIESLEILAAEGGRPFTVRPGGVLLEPGSMWSGDAVLLSATAGSVRYARGDTLFREATPEFVAGTYSASSSRPAWMAGLLDAHRGFALKMAPALCLHWGPRGSVCAWLNAYGAFYRDNRPGIELAARHADLLLEGLFALRARWNGVFTELVASMDGSARGRMERHVGANGAGRFVGFLLAPAEDESISVQGLAAAVRALSAAASPEFERCLASPMYARMVRRVEESGRELSPVVERLRSRL